MSHLFASGVGIHVSHLGWWGGERAVVSRASVRVMEMIVVRDFMVGDLAVVGLGWIEI